jgi:phage-related protein
MVGMEVEIEVEVESWYLGLDPAQRDIAYAHIELLAEYGHRLRMPHSRPLGGGLSELRFDMSRRAWRITYWMRPDGVIILLTVFHKQRDNEAHQVQRARAALDRYKKLHRDKP